MPVVTIAGIQDANSRLNPWRKMLADLDEAVKNATALYTGIQEKEATAGRLQQDVMALQKRRDELTAELTALKAEFQKNETLIANKMQKAGRDLAAAQESTRNQIDEMGKQTAARIKQMNETAEARIAELQGKITQEENRLKKLVQEREALQKRVMSI
jgi:chromosome segregation ATPase